MPTAPIDEEYRNQVQTRIQTLLSGQRPRDPHLSALSTRRLILEGVVEEARIYRLRKEMEARAAREREGRGKRAKRHGKREHGHGHGHGSRNGEHGDGDKDRGRRHGFDLDAVVTEGAGHGNPMAMASGGAGPGVEATGVAHAQSHHAHSHTDSSRPLPATPHTPTSHAPSSRRRCGPDGTPFGNLPKKGKGMGFGAHYLNTYKHIKAEHEAGHRTRSGLEKTMDAIRGKGKTADKKSDRDGGGGDESSLRGNRGPEVQFVEPTTPAHPLRQSNAPSPPHSHRTIPPSTHGKPLPGPPPSAQTPSQRQQEHWTPPDRVFSYGPPTLQAERISRQFPGPESRILGAQHDGAAASYYAASPTSGSSQRGRKVGEASPEAFGGVDVEDGSRGVGGMTTPSLREGDVVPTGSAMPVAGGSGQPVSRPLPPPPPPPRASTATTNPLSSLLTAIQSHTTLRPVPASSINDSSAAQGGHVLCSPSAHSHADSGSEADWAAADDGASETGGPGRRF